MRDSSFRGARGISLVEVLVVIGIVSLLAVLIAPALSAAREAARRAKCLSNLRSIGIAMNSYASDHSLFPPASIYSISGIVDGAPPGTHDFSADSLQKDGFRSNWVILLLPHLGSESLYEGWNSSSSISAFSNTTTRGISLVSFLCPSDAIAKTVRFGFPEASWSRGNYALNAGSDPFCMRSKAFGKISCSNFGLPDGVGVEASPSNPTTVAAIWGGGVGGVNKSFAPGSFEKGVSKVVLVEEIRAGSDWKDMRGVWALPTVGGSITFGHGGRPDAHGLGPNSPRRNGDIVQECTSNLAAELPCERNYLNMRALPRSMHQGLVHVLYADGSAVAIENSIDLEIWTSMHGRTSDTGPAY